MAPHSNSWKKCRGKREKERWQFQVWESIKCRNFHKYLNWKNNPILTIRELIIDSYILRLHRQEQLSKSTLTFIFQNKKCTLVYKRKEQESSRSRVGRIQVGWGSHPSFHPKYHLLFITKLVVSTWQKENADRYRFDKPQIKVFKKEKIK